MILDHLKGTVLESIRLGLETFFAYLTNPDQWQWITADKLFVKLSTSYVIIDSIEVAKCEFETLR